MRFMYVLALWMALVSPALAQDIVPGSEEESVDVEPARPVNLDDERVPMLSDEQALLEEQAPPPPARSSTDPREEPHESYWFLGLTYRLLYVPKFALNWFVDGGADVVASSYGGITFEHRKDGLSVIGTLYYQDATFRLPFREKGDLDINTEVLNARYGAIFATATLLWYTGFANDMFAIEYGFNIGAGVLLDYGTRRWEAYPSTAPGSVAGYNECAGPSSPDAAYCGMPTRLPTNTDGERGEHYNVQPRRWSQGGSVPDVVPMLGPVFALRFKPIRQLQIRTEVGLTGVIPFQFGVTAAYGF